MSFRGVAKLKVLLLTRSLNAGGAERQLVILAKSLHSRGIPVTVMVFYGDGPFRPELDEAGVQVIDLKKSGRWDVIRFAFRMVQSVREFRPDVIYSFMGANIIATCLKPLLGKTKIVWGVRSSDMDLSYYDWLSRFFDHIAISLSRFADAIICKSERGQEHIRRQGYANSAIAFIPNGIDLARFMHTASSRQARRSGWDVPEERVVLGIMARIDGMKDHTTLLEAVKRALEVHPKVRLVCVGSGDETLHERLMQQTLSLGIQYSVHWVGHSCEPVKDYSAFDVLVSSSMTEAFPNVIGEAMACGLPVVATDVGDCRRIVGDCGWIVPPKDPEALAAAIGYAIAALPNWSAEHSRKRIEENFSVDVMVDKTVEVLNSAVKS
jgi:glycosyltransferase involved in cell wall biosynthesis